VSAGTPAEELPPDGSAGSALERAMHAVNRAALGVGMLALVAAAFVLTYSVVSRYLFKASTDWQDESAVFLLVGVTFLCAPYVQQQRGHIGIDALAASLSPGVNRVRRMVVDFVCALFCAFFAWKSWLLLYEAVVDRQTTSSSWAAPLWIPYGLMALGMTLLTLQIVLQLLPRARGHGDQA
jgi:TRAP-type C4-dicarboxylate transport system permease small subunit